MTPAVPYYSLFAADHLGGPESNGKVSSGVSGEIEGLEHFQPINRAGATYIQPNLFFTTLAINDSDNSSQEAFDEIDGFNGSDVVNGFDFDSNSESNLDLQINGFLRSSLIDSSTYILL